VDGTVNSTAKANGSYTFSNVGGDHTITVEFDSAINTHSLTG